MTLRYIKGKPVGLDWTVCTDGNPQPSIWGLTFGGKKKKPYRPRSQHKRQNRSDVKNHGAGQGHRRTPEPVARAVVNLYRDQGLPSRVVAERLGIARQTVYVVLDRYGIPRRNKSVSMKMSIADRKSQDLQAL